MTYSLWEGDCWEVLQQLPAVSVQTVITSPPYFNLRSSGTTGELGLERTPEVYTQALLKTFRQVWRVLKPNGTLWLNLGDCYAGAGYSNHKNTGGLLRAEGGKQRHTTGTGLPAKSLLGIPWRVAFALQADGWLLRSDIVWAKSNAMPSPVRDRPTSSHEYLFLFAKANRYKYNAEAILEPTVSNHASGNGFVRPERLSIGGRGTPTPWALQPLRNKRDVWQVPVKPFKGAHFSTFPPDLIVPCVLAGSDKGDVVLDPFAGAGTTLLVARMYDRAAWGIELNEGYAAIARDRLARVLGEEPDESAAFRQSSDQRLRAGA